MRHILAILMLVLTVWAVLPAGAQAHGLSHAMPDAGACPHCADDPGAEHRDGHLCHHGAGCALHGLPAGASLPTPSSTLADRPRPAAHAAPRSALLARDLPPPRS